MKNASNFELSMQTKLAQEMYYFDNLSYNNFNRSNW